MFRREQTSDGDPSPPLEKRSTKVLHIIFDMPSFAVTDQAGAVWASPTIGHLLISGVSAYHTSAPKVPEMQHQKITRGTTTIGRPIVQRAKIIPYICDSELYEKFGSYNLYILLMLRQLHKGEYFLRRVRSVLRMCIVKKLRSNHGRCRNREKYKQQYT